jgi:hypothetical protein
LGLNGNVFCAFLVRLLARKCSTQKWRLKMDHMSVIDAPFMLAEGGYAGVLSGGRWHTLRGRKAKAKRVRHRAEARKLNR